jgi:hypothetical protein
MVFTISEIYYKSIKQDTASAPFVIKLQPSKFVLPPIDDQYMLHTGRSRVRFPMSSSDFSIDLILPAALYGPGVDSAPNGNEYQDSTRG